MFIVDIILVNMTLFAVLLNAKQAVITGWLDAVSPNHSGRRKATTKVGAYVAEHVKCRVLSLIELSRMISGLKSPHESNTPFLSLTGDSSSGSVAK